MAKKKMIVRAVVTGMLLGAFGLGYVCGSVSQPRAEAQGVGGLLEQAGKAGGPLAGVAQLGSSILEMQNHVSGLQKNLDTLKKVEAALTGKQQ
jgi:hypothetical protein